MLRTYEMMVSAVNDGYLDDSLPNFLPSGPCARMRLGTPISVSSSTITWEFPKIRGPNMDLNGRASHASGLKTLRGGGGKQLQPMKYRFKLCCGWYGATANRTLPMCCYSSTPSGGSLG